MVFTKENPNIPIAATAADRQLVFYDNDRKKKINANHDFQLLAYIPE